MTLTSPEMHCATVDAKSDHALPLSILHTLYGDTLYGDTLCPSWRNTAVMLESLLEPSSYSLARLGTGPLATRIEAALSGKTG